MQALDGVFRENEKQEKLHRLEKRRKHLSELLLKETKEYEVHVLVSPPNLDSPTSTSLVSRNTDNYNYYCLY